MTGAPDALRRVSVVDELTGVLRDRILDGDLTPGTPLRETDIARVYAVSRHTLRAALRELAVEGLVRIEPNRGASVARLDAADIQGLYELRAALELEAAHLALERHDGRLPHAVVAAVANLTATCRNDGQSWYAVAAAHATVHGSIVASAGSRRIEASYAALARELQLFLVQLHPVWSLDRMVTHHEALIVELEQEGPPALRRHLQDGADAVLGAARRP